MQHYTFVLTLVKLLADEFDPEVTYKKLTLIALLSFLASNSALVNNRSVHIVLKLPLNSLFNSLARS